MRLLNALSFQFEEYFGDSIPHYAILSHTWGKHEISFQDFDLCWEESNIRCQKILKTCQQALRDNLTYVWIDTCCIDKRSSTELSEAVNSMFNWYARSKVCYAYIEDGRSFNLKAEGDIEEFRKCRWFSRGWTLQELITPPKVVFFSENWIEFGTRQSISTILSRITGIDLEILENPAPERLFQVSIANRMSWASGRVTTRLEDMAYCLLGLFDVHIPLLYGEGERAFIRLQEEIMKHSYDHSLLAWGQFYNWTDIVSSNNRGGKLLAQSPAAFRFSTSIVSFSPGYETVPYAKTNYGPNIELPIRKVSESKAIALLNCYLPNDLDHQLAILVDGSQSAKFRCDDRLYLYPRCEIEFGGKDSEFRVETLYFRDSVRRIDAYGSDPRTDSIFISRCNDYFITKVEPSSQWDSCRHLIRKPCSIPFAGCHVTVHLDYQLPMKKIIKSKPRLVVYIAFIIAGPHIESITSCAIRRIAAEEDAHGSVSGYRGFKKNGKIEVTEDGITFEISIKLAEEVVMGQFMDVLYISRPSVTCYSYGGQ